MTTKRFFRTEQDDRGEFQEYREREDGSIEVALMDWRNGRTPFCITRDTYQPGDDFYDTAKQALDNIHGQAAVRQAWSI